MHVHSFLPPLFRNGIMFYKRPLAVFEIFKRLKAGIWLLGVPSWLFGLVDRTVASFADGYTSALDLVQLFTAAFFFVSWLFLKPSFAIFKIWK